MFNTIVKPVAALLDKIKFTYKFMIIFVVFLVPIFYLAYSNITIDIRNLHIAEEEHFGVTHVKGVRTIMNDMARSRGMTNAYLNGKKELRADIEQAQQKVLKDLDILLAIDKDHDNVFKIRDEVVAIRDDWSVYSSKVFAMSSAEAFAGYTKFVERTRYVLKKVLDNSGLTLDPNITSHYLMDVTSISGPFMLEAMGKSRGIGSGTAARGEHTTDGYLALVNNISIAKDLLRSVKRDLDKVYADSTVISEKLKPYSDKFISSVEEFISVTTAQLINADTISYDAKKYFSLGSNAIKDANTFYDMAIVELDEVLLARYSEAQNTIVTNIVMIIILVLVAFYITLAVLSSMNHAITQISSTLDAVSDGDLTVRVDLHNKDEMQVVADSLNQMIDQTANLVSQVVSATQEVASSSAQMQATAGEAQQGIEKQNMEIEQVATAINEMSATVQEVSHNAASASEQTGLASQDAENGSNVVNQAVSATNSLSNEMSHATEAIKALAKDSDNIGVVLDVIRGIAEQTNLLALNAAIEAARAGEQGRGFAVVADEVRTLASRTQTSTEEIQRMIEKLQQGSHKAVLTMEKGNEQTKISVARAGEAGEALTAIVGAVTNINDLNMQIASAAEEQSSVAEEINRNVVNIRDIASATVEGSEQTVESSVRLGAVAQDLLAVVQQFKIS